MRILVLSLAALALLAGLVVLIGFLLPATREGRAEAVIAAPPDAILAVIADVEAQPEWRAGVGSVVRTDTGWGGHGARRAHRLRGRGDGARPHPAELPV